MLQQDGDWVLWVDHPDPLLAEEPVLSFHLEPLRLLSHLILKPLHCVCLLRRQGWLLAKFDRIVRHLRAGLGLYDLGWRC